MPVSVQHLAYWTRHLGQVDAEMLASLSQRQQYRGRHIEAIAISKEFCQSRRWESEFYMSELIVVVVLSLHLGLARGGDWLRLPHPTCLYHDIREGNCEQHKLTTNFFGYGVYEAIRYAYRSNIWHRISAQYLDFPICGSRELMLGWPLPVKLALSIHHPSLTVSFQNSLVMNLRVRAKLMASVP